MDELIIKEPPIYLVSIANDLKRLNNIIIDKDDTINNLKKQIEYLRSELTDKELQMNRLIKKNVELSVELLKNKNKTIENKNTEYVGYMTLDN